MSDISTLCVYCGSRIDVDPQYRTAAQRLGTVLAQAGVSIVFGGGRIGLMGLLADAALDAGGAVIGVIPRHLDEIEVGHRNVTTLHVVDNMHTRKELMFRLADGFVILPGGLGTLDETFEIITWKQLRLHDKPVVIVNTGGYWNPLLALFNHISATGFMQDGAESFYHAVNTVDEVLPALAAAPAPRIAPEVNRI